ncbi:MAG: hypothetical protein ACXWVD_00490 [Telluria sp.]
MAIAITAYLAADGQVHRSLEEAEFADYSSSLATDVRDFIAQHGVLDRDGELARMICKWDLWRMGGYEGWLAGREDAHMLDAPPEQDRPEEPAAPAAAPAQPDHPPRHPRLVPVPRPSSEYRKRVAVVGLPKQYHRQVEKDFGTEFKLNLLDAKNSMDKLEGLRGYHKVIVMDKYAHPKALDILRRIGQEPLRLMGPVETLHEALTALYLQCAA